MSQAFEAYVGRYSNDLLGEMVVELNENGQLRIRWGRLNAIATAYDTADHVRVEFSHNSGDVLSFALKDGAVDAILFAGATFKKIR